MIYDSFHLNKAVGHVPLYWSKLAYKFLKFLSHQVCVVVTDKRVNRGIGVGLQIPVGYGDNLAIK